MHAVQTERTIAGQAGLLDVTLLIAIANNFKKAKS